MKMKVEKTDRGFIRIGFIDLYDKACSLQESSLATDNAIWLGTDEDRMHLNVEQVETLLPYLQSFVKMGDLTAFSPRRVPLRPAWSPRDIPGLVLWITARADASVDQYEEGWSFSINGELDPTIYPNEFECRRAAEIVLDFLESQSHTSPKRNHRK